MLCDKTQEIYKHSTKTEHSELVKMASTICPDIPNENQPEYQPMNEEESHYYFLNIRSTVFVCFS